MLVAEEPRNGYQLMQTIEARSDGRWRPSPGSIYPTLAQLEDEGLIRTVELAPSVRAPAGARVFEITELGRERLAARGDATPPWELDEQLAPVGEVKSQLKLLAVATAQVMHAGDQRQLERAAQTLAETRRALYRILAEDEGE